MREHTIEVMIPEDKIKEQVRRLAQEINRDYASRESELVLIGLLRGSFIFLADLTRLIERNHTVDFITASSYGNATLSSREVKIVKDLDGEIAGKDVVIVEDIIDTGFTLKRVCEMLLLRNPKSLRICTLLDKPLRREVECPVDYTGFSIPDEFVVGYGIDYAQHYRNLPYIAKVKLTNND